MTLWARDAAPGRTTGSAGVLRSPLQFASRPSIAVAGRGGWPNHFLYGRGPLREQRLTQGLYGCCSLTFLVCWVFEWHSQTLLAGGVGRRVHIPGRGHFPNVHILAVAGKGDPDHLPFCSISTPTTGCFGPKAHPSASASDLPGAAGIPRVIGGKNLFGGPSRVNSRVAALVLPTFL